MSHSDLLTKLRHVPYLGHMNQPAYDAGTIPPETMGWRLQRALAFADVSVEQMSEELGVSRSTVSRWLNDRGTPSLGYLKIWALRTGTPYSWLTHGNEGLPRVDSNHQPAGWLTDSKTPPSTRELKDIGSLRKRIRYGTLAERRTS